MNAEQEMVRAFHRAFLHPVAQAPVKLTPDRVGPRASWMREEVEEFETADTVEDQVDAIIDLMYFALGTMVELGVESAPVFEIVHKANMNKLGPDGKPLLRKGDGKVAKPDTWVDPKQAVAAEIRRQLDRAGSTRARQSA